MDEPQGRRLTADGAASHPNNTSSTTNTDRDLDRLGTPPAAAELQAQEIHHADAAPAVAGGRVGGTSRGDETTARRNGQEANSNPVLANFWKAVRRLPSYLRLGMALLGDPRVPRRAKVLLAVGGAYTVSPIDFVPGIIPVAGQLDDLYVLLTALRRALRSSPGTVADEHLTRVGIKSTDLDDDLAAVRALVRQAVKTSVRVGGRLAKQASAQVVAMTSRSLERGRRAGDNEPL